MSFLHEPGDLSRTPLAAVLLEALNLRATGVLLVEHAGGTSRLWLRDGRPVGAQVVAGFRPIGHMLLQAGLIDIDVLSRSLAVMAQGGRPHGEILIEMGAITRPDLDRALAEQQAGYFALIAALESGPFRFDPAQPVPEWTRGSLLSPLRTIVDALERPQAGALVVSALQPVASGGLRLASGYRDVAGAFRWTAAEQALVARIETPQTLDAFFAPSEVPPERARAILSALLLLGLAMPASERPVATGDTGAGLTLALNLEPETRSSPRPTGAQARPTPAAGTPAAGTAPTPSPIEGPARRSDPAEARARRQRLLQQAMKNMGIGPFSRPGGEAPAPPPTAAAGAAPPRAPATAPGSADDQLRKALLAAAPRAKERDYFARLGLPETAGREDVKKAFLTLARRFHPDRFSAPALADLADTVKDFFTAVNEAYEVLADDRKRAEYLAARKSAAQQGHPESAKVDFQKGEACLRTRDFGRARGFLESAVRADPRPEYLAALAFALIADPRQRDRERARTLLEEATRDASCDRAHYVAGILARDEGDDGRAERAFRAAIAANARNAEAVRELRALESRRADRRGR